MGHGRSSALLALLGVLWFGGSAGHLTSNSSNILWYDVSPASCEPFGQACDTNLQIYVIHVIFSNLCIWNHMKFMKSITYESDWICQISSIRQFDVRYDRWAFRRPGVNFRSVKFDKCNAAESNSATSFLFFHFAALPSAFWLSALRHKNEHYPETTHVCNRRAVFAKFQMFYSQVSVSIFSKSFLLNQLLTLHCFHSFATLWSAGVEPLP